MTEQQIEAMPPGRVLKRWITPSGQHQKMRIVKPRTYFDCDDCGKEIKGIAVKTEYAAAVTILTQCPKCAAKELSIEIDLDQLREDIKKQREASG